MLHKECTESMSLVGPSRLVWVTLVNVEFICTYIGIERILEDSNFGKESIKWGIKKGDFTAIGINNYDGGKKGLDESEGIML